MTEDERADLARAAASRRRRAFGWLIGMAAGWATATALIALAPEMPGRDVVFPVLIIAAIVATPVLTVLARDDFRLARAMRKGLKVGRVQRFTGRLNPAVAVYDATATRLLSKRTLQFDVEVEQSVEVLADGGLVWRVNGARPRRWFPAHVSEVARAPDFAATAAEWVQPYTAPDGETTWWNRRSMTDAEHEELRKHVARIFRPAPVWILFNVYVIAILVWGAWRSEPFPFVIWLAFAVWMDFRLARAMPHILILRKDLRLGAVAIVRTELAGQADGGSSPEQAALSPATEFLPFSRLAWSHDGQPAPWRRSRGG